MHDQSALGISAPTREHADRLANALDEEFLVEVVPGGSYTVRVTPIGGETEKLVTLFNAIGRWLSEGGLASCDVKYGQRGLTILPATADNLGDPTAFLIERARQLEHALASRVVIEQAKGLLAERHGLTVDEAFERLRHKARSSRRRIHELAAEVIRGEAHV
ncbi:MAG: ANTAR domain-containing protein [Thermoleophilia bacterium]|nr:ANTAR domain-containing protein [Thermoleophilia bacterium]